MAVSHEGHCLVLIVTVAGSAGRLARRRRSGRARTSLTASWTPSRCGGAAPIGWACACTLARAGLTQACKLAVRPSTLRAAPCATLMWAPAQIHTCPQANCVPWDHALETQLCFEIKTFLLAGHETSAAMLTWSCYELTQDTNVLQKVRQGAQLGAASSQRACNLCSVPSHLTRAQQCPHHARTCTRHADARKHATCTRRSVQRRRRCSPSPKGARTAPCPAAERSTACCTPWLC